MLAENKMPSVCYWCTVFTQKWNASSGF